MISLSKFYHIACINRAVAVAGVMAMCVFLSDAYAIGISDGKPDSVTILNPVVIPIQEVQDRLNARPQQPIEGIWELTGGGTIAIIHKDGDQGFVIEAIDSPDRSVMPGTEIGRISPTAVPTKYEATLYTKIYNGRTSSPKKIIMQLNDATHLSFVTIKKGVRVNLFRLIPYMFRGIVTPIDSKPENVNGAVRVGRPLKGKPITPRYL